MYAKRLAAAVVVLTLTGTPGFASTKSVQGYGQDQRQPQGYGQGQGGWDAPPDGYRDVQRQGFHDGIEAARQDFQSQQPPNPQAHREFRHPQVPPEARDDYRAGYRKGYSVAMHHMHDGGDHDHDHDHDGPR